MLVYCCWKWQQEITKISVRICDNCVTDVNATAAKLGDRCAQLPGVHTITGGDTDSCIFGKEKTSAPSVMMTYDVGVDVLGAQAIDG